MMHPVLLESSNRRPLTHQTMGGADPEITLAEPAEVEALNGCGCGETSIHLTFGATCDGTLVVLVDDEAVHNADVSAHDGKRWF